MKLFKIWLHFMYSVIHKWHVIVVNISGAASTRGDSSPRRLLSLIDHPVPLNSAVKGCNNSKDSRPVKFMQNFSSDMSNENSNSSCEAFCVLYTTGVICSNHNNQCGVSLRCVLFQKF